MLTYTVVLRTQSSDLTDGFLLTFTLACADIVSSFLECQVLLEGSVIASKNLSNLMPEGGSQGFRGRVAD